MPPKRDRKNRESESGSESEQPAKARQVSMFAATVSYKKKWDGDAAKLAEFKGPTREKLFKFLKSRAKAFIFQLECTNNSTRTEKNEDLIQFDRDNWHYQIYYCTSARVSRELTELNAFLKLDVGRVHVSIASSDGVKDLKTYCMKKDCTYRDGPWADKPMEDILKEIEAKKPYDGSDLPPSDCMYTCQQDLEFYCKGDVDPRETLVWYDQVGRSGKTIACKSICFKNGGLPLTYGKAEDIANLVLSQDVLPQLLIFNLPRTKPNAAFVPTMDMWNAIEQLKDGTVITGKYQGGVRLFTPRQVCVLTNVLPPMEALSMDRWLIVRSLPVEGMDRLCYLDSEKKLCLLNPDFTPTVPKKWIAPGTRKLLSNRFVNMADKRAEILAGFA